MEETEDKSPVKSTQSKSGVVFVKPERRHSVAFADFAINNPRSSIAVSCTLLFAMSQLFFGIVIPLSDSFVTISEKESEHAYYLEAFLMIQYVTAIICVFYLQGYVYLNDCVLKKNKNKIKEKKSPNDSDEMNEELMETDSQKVTFHISRQNTEDTEPEENRFNKDDNESSNCNHLHNMSSLVLHGDKSFDNDDKIFTSPNLDDYYIIRESNGINLYLRLGAVGFGFGVMVHDGFKIADQVRLQDNNCHNQLWTPKQCLHLAYIFIQTFFIFKYHRATFLKQKAIIRFILFHLTISNICQWFKTVVYEINHELMDESKMGGHTNSYGTANSTHHNVSCLDQLSYTVSPYLFPCAIEYSLICAAIFYKMLQRVGGEFDEKSPTEHSETPVVVKNVKYSECHRAHKGLFVGLLFFMVTLVGLAIFLLFKRTHQTQTLAVMVYQISEIILLVSSAIAIVCAFIKMRRLRFCQLTEEEALDDNLLLVGLAGVFAYNLFLFISTIYSSNKLKKNVSHGHEWTIILFLCKSLTEIVQSMLQVLFVLETSRKCAHNFSQVRTKPGRSLVTFLIVTNLAMWTVSIFEAKRADEHLMFTQYYQKTPWSIITHTLLPLIIFFRFHSTICLTDIWAKAYKINVSK